MPTDGDGHHPVLPAPWPAAGFDELTWRSTIPADMLSAEVRAQMQLPFHATVPAEIGELALTLPASTVDLAEDAATMIAAFVADMDAANGPVLQVLTTAEATASSQIESIVSDAEQIALAELGRPTRTAALQVAGNTAATRAASGMDVDPDRGTMRAIHRALLERTEPRIAGVPRTEQTWLGGGTYSPHGAQFVPPAPARIGVAADDLSVFVHRTDIEPVPFAALLHAQFETIHPYQDGNGRAGRAIIHAAWRSTGLTRSTIVPISSGLLGARSEYFAALTAYRGGDVQQIVEVLSWAVIDSISNARELVAEMTSIRHGWAATIDDAITSPVWPLIDLVCRQPVLHAPAVQAELGISEHQAKQALDELVEIGALSGPLPRRGTTLWQSAQMLTAMDAFTARAGVRHRGDNRRHGQRQARPRPNQPHTPPSASS